MGLANKMNTANKSTVAESVDTKKLEYFKAKELIDSDKFPIRLKGFFFQSGEYGESVTCVSDEIGINMPSRYVDVFKEYSDDEIEDVKQGLLGIASITEFKSKRGKTVSIEFIDMEPEELPFE